MDDQLENLRTSPFDRYKGRESPQSRRRKNVRLLLSLAAGGVVTLLIALSFLAYVASHPVEAGRKPSESDGLPLLAIFLMVDAAICGTLGYLVGKAKRAEAAGCILGAVFGPIGLLVTLALDSRPLCQQCGTRLNGSPVICPSCHTSLRKPPQPEPQEPKLPDWMLTPPPSDSPGSPVPPPTATAVPPPARGSRPLR
jgi:hypothetical protein